MNIPRCIYTAYQAVAKHSSPSEWHSITAGPLVMFLHFLPWTTALSFPYEIIPSVLLAADCGLMFFFSAFSHFPNFPGLAEPRGGPGKKFKQLLEPCEHFKLHKFGWSWGFFKVCLRSTSSPALYWLGGERKRKYIPVLLCFLEITAFTVEVSRWLFYPKQKVWWRAEFWMNDQQQVQCLCICF